MNGESLHITEEKLARLREIVPEAFSESEIDWEKLRIALGAGGEFKEERYHLNWAGKTGAYRALQSPTTDTLAPCREESVKFDAAEHLFIEGENLTVLKVLQKSYFGKIKMIYIDPPYNTGNDHFIYPDRFTESKKDYLTRIGDRNEDGRMTREGLFRKNSRENGHYHSNWLSMIYPRLFLARNLLSEDGVIFVSIDDNEMHNLRMVMNEIFGEENIDCFVWHKAGDGRYGKMKNTDTFRKDHEYVVVAYRNFDKLNKLWDFPQFQMQYGNSDNDPRGAYKAGSISRREDASNPAHANYYTVISPSGKAFTRQFDMPEPEFEQLNDDNRIYWGKKGDSVPAVKIFINERRFSTPSSLLRKGSTYEGTEELEKMFPDGIGASDLRPKPSSLLFLLVQLATEKDSIVLDFFAGSCTTAHAVLNLNKEDGGNRKFICVQMPEKCDEKTEAHKAGYKTIADIGKERIRRVIKNGKIKDGFKVFKLRQSNFKKWRGAKTPEELETQLKLHIDPVTDGAGTEDILCELLLKNGITLTANIKEKDNWQLVQDGELKIAVALDNIDSKTIKSIIAAKPSKFITLDRLFQQNDQLKTNIALQMEDAGVGFEVV